MWLEAAIGAASGAMALALLVRSSAKTLADYGYLALVAMLAIYIGARLVTGPFEAIVAEMAVVSLAVIVTRMAMNVWLPAIGCAILLHGLYDAIFGPSTGVAEWYPALCSGFDVVVGVGLLMLLSRKRSRTPD